MVLGRLSEPGSRCAAYAWAEDVYGAGFEAPKLHDLYRALDLLAKNKEAIERGWFARHQDLFTDTDLVYFDTTSTYLEGTHPEGLAQLGYSRDKRKDRRQLALGVVLTRGGLPVAHLLLPGNTADPATFREALSYLREVLGVTRAVLCCDRGMVSEGNLQAMREAGLPYLVATRLQGDKGLWQLRADVPDPQESSGRSTTGRSVGPRGGVLFRVRPELGPGGKETGSGSSGGTRSRP